MYVCMSIKPVDNDEFECAIFQGTRDPASIMSQNLESTNSEQATQAEASR